MQTPQIHGELLEEFPNWDRPSDNMLTLRLERNFRMQNSAIKPFIANLRDSLEFAKGFEKLGPASSDVSHAKAQDVAPKPDSTELQRSSDPPAPPGTMRLPMPGSVAYIVLPDVLEPAQVKRVLSWLQRVVAPAVEFAGEQAGDDEAI